MIPLVILPVAVATCVLIPVVGTPTEIDVVGPTYPSPPSFTVIDCTVPPTEITAENYFTYICNLLSTFKWENREELPINGWRLILLKGLVNGAYFSPKID